MSAETAGWFYDFNNERKGPFSTEQVSALLTAGVITEHTKVWSEALAEWTPLFRTELRALLGERPVTPPALGQPAGSKAPTSYPVYNNRRLGTILRWASLFCAGFSILPIVQIVQKKTIEEQYAAIKFYESDAALMVFGVPMLITVILFLLWKYRATANLFNVVGNQTVTPAGAVYWYFVPFLWFRKPYEAMRNLWNGFGADSQYIYLLGAWWLTWWAGAGAAVLAGIVLPDEVKLVSEAKAYVFWNVAISGIDGLSFFFAADIIKRISEAETNRMGALKVPETR